MSIKAMSFYYHILQSKSFITGGMKIFSMLKDLKGKSVNLWYGKGSLLAVGYSDSGSGLTGFAVQVFVETTGLGTGENIVSGLFVIRRTAHSPSTNIGIM